ncbi:zinc C3HC4 type (RING finger) [Pyrrhoderma noxium]|uniref:Zinc C3HC4 type (RING finger) n=1 Tax=Pyrrhoderma noxium TaxID=2282107 RepID=A0A286UN65_9AGAM|nr:zinc C3HC4 type (RING finger) [Pyrrhoderma noxium]
MSFPGDHAEEHENSSARAEAIRVMREMYEPGRTFAQIVNTSLQQTEQLKREAEEAHKLLQDLPDFEPSDNIEDNCGICLLSFADIIEDNKKAMNEELRRHAGPSSEVLETPFTGTGIVKLPDCGHIFCRKDLKEWVASFHGTCPACRQEFFSFTNFDEIMSESSDGGEYIPEDDEDEVFSDDMQPSSDFEMESDTEYNCRWTSDPESDLREESVERDQDSEDEGRIDLELYEPESTQIDESSVGERQDLILALDESERESQIRRWYGWEWTPSNPQNFEYIASEMAHDNAIYDVDKDQSDSSSSESVESEVDLKSPTPASSSSKVTQ